MKTYYEALGIKENASPREISKAYRALALKYHPDMEGGDEEEFKALKEIYESLMDPVKREKYDSFLEKEREKIAEKEKKRNSGLEIRVAEQEIKTSRIKTQQATMEYK